MAGREPRTGVAPELDTVSWRRLDALLDRALALPAGERKAFVDGLAGDDARYRDELRRLLASYDAAQTFLDEPAAAGYAGTLLTDPDDTRGRSLEGRRIGSYRLLRLLGRGGFGAVYLAARDDQQYEKKVAIKLLDSAFDREAARERFLAERQILADLEHPGIARLLDGGVTEDGRPFLVIELVLGWPIDVYCERRELPIRSRLDLFLKACEAVSYAHRHLVVHRDLKPSNIFVDSEGEVKLLDFGIAKVLADRGGSAGRTRAGLRPMTPEYAAPEQIRGGAITPATDVYSLGVLLYRLLTGCSPYPPHDESRFETGRVILEAEARRPSSVLTTEEAAARPPGTVPRLRRRLRGDLDAIVLKTLRKEPDERYGSVEAFAGDLRRHLGGLPVAARHGAFGYRAGRFLRRHAVAVAVAVAFLGLLVAWALNAERQARRIAHERDRAERVAALLPELFWSLEPGELQTAAVSPRELLDRGLETMEQRLADEPDLRARILTLAAEVYMRTGDFREGERIARRALELWHELGRARSVEAAATLAKLGMALERQGRLDESRRTHLEALEIRRDLLGPNHPDTAESLHGYALVLDRGGEYPAAEEHYREALRIRRQTLGDSRDLAFSLTNLAIMLYYQDEDDEAEKLAREALAMRRRVLGEDHPDLAHSYHTLGTLADARGDFEEAAEMLTLSIDLNRRTKGPLHPHVGYGWRSLGQARRKQGRFEEAAAAFRSALEAFEASYGAAHDDTALARYSLGLALIEGGDPAGEALVRAGHEGLRAALGEDHPTVRSTAERVAALDGATERAP